ncbi:hypothetical protein INF26_03905 [Olsenella sp. DSM 107455]|uniref:Uncharacterized protein n=1 Tax=Thermophilibacter gallinarum TaxID=2779357 RepID=A0ABR9QSD3_9ACTN|nr:hypothetical protein [Thermophilibacter gallinarum]MBE5023995.1 hypothetical protein [Thermophilibacter gallinarum]
MVAEGLIDYLKSKGWHACTYKELAEHLNRYHKEVLEGSDLRPFHYRNLSDPLGRLMRRCRDAGLPYLSAFVVRSDSKRKHFEGAPGLGFYDMYETLGNPGAPDNEQRRRIADEERAKSRSVSREEWRKALCGKVSA